MIKISRSKLAEVIADRLTKTTDLQALSREIAAYLLHAGRIGELDSIMRDVLQYRADRGLVEVVATPAHQLTEDIRTEIKAVVSKLYPDSKRIIISEVIDPKVIGGVRLEFANAQLDLSIRSKLNHFKQLTTATGGIT